MDKESGYWHKFQIRPCVPKQNSFPGMPLLSKKDVLSFAYSIAYPTFATFLIYKWKDPNDKKGQIKVEGCF